MTIKKRRNFAERRSDSGLGQMERKRKQRKEFLTRALGRASIAALAVAAAINLGLDQEKDESPEATVSVQVGDVVQGAIDEAIDKDRQRSPEVKKVERQIDGLAAQAADVTRRAKDKSETPGAPFIYQETPGNDLVVEKNADGTEMYTKLNSATITTGKVEMTVTYKVCTAPLPDRDNCLNINDEVDPEGKNIVGITTKDYSNNNKGVVVRRSNSTFGGLYSLEKRGVPKTPEQRDKVPVNATAMVWKGPYVRELTDQAANDLTNIGNIVVPH